MSPKSEDPLDMDEQHLTSSLVAFGRFRFEPSTGELWRDGHAVRLAPKPAQVLGLLVSSSGRLLSRREIELSVWGDVPIDLDRSVNFAIRQIRSALGDSADSPTYIETLPKRGYRFIAPITRHAPAQDSAPPVAPDEALPRVQGSARRGAVGRLLGIAAVTALVVVGVVSGSRASTATGEDGLRPMLAVLPLDPLGDAADLDYFVSGLTDELINRLARLDPARLGVVARTSAGRAASDGQTDTQIADALAATYLLSGSVTPDGDAVRIHVRLVTPEDGSVVWSQRYVESVPISVELEFDIAARVADALRERLVPGLAEATQRTTDRVSPARDGYLRGSYLLKQGRSRRADALAALNSAIAADSSYAPARATLGRALLGTDDKEAGRGHLAAAIALDPELADPHITLAVDALYTRWDQATADNHFREALRLEPGNVLSHHPYAYHLSIAGRHSEAIREMETALRLDPVSPLVNGDVGRIYYRAGRFEEAKAQCQRTLDLVPDDATALSCLINIHLLQDRPDLALPFAQRSIASSRGDPSQAPVLAASEPAVAMQAFFEWKLEGLRKAADRGFDVDVAMAQALLWLGRTEEAVDHLETALQQRSTILPQVPGDPCFALLAGNARYEAVLTAMGIREF